MSPLARRRQLRRRRILIAGCVTFVLTFGLSVYGLWQPSVRISNIKVTGDESLLPGPAVGQVVEESLRSTRGWIVPRDSIFFYPKSRVRHAIVEAHPEIATVSLSRTGFRSISVQVLEHTAVGIWCGAMLTDDQLDCYFFNPNGFIYAPVPEPALERVATEEAASAWRAGLETLNSFDLYAPKTAGGPLGATILRAAQLPDTFNFARECTALGSPATAVVIRNDEVDLHLASGTRITYVIGREQEAYTALTSAKNNLSLSDGSLLYVDLRFAGKVYLKRKIGDEVAL